MSGWKMHDESVSRRRFLAGMVAPVTGPWLPGRRSSSPPNILWIIAEDLSPDLGCYGNRLVQTPHLDRLAAEGMRFTRAYVTGPVCSASRSAIATGMYQTSIGAHHHRSHRQDGYRLPAPVRVFTAYLREAGYHTSNLRNSHGLQGTGKTDFNFDAQNPFDGEDWSERKPGQPFYAQINFSETHRPFKRFPRHPVDPAQVQLPPYYPDHPAVRLDWALYLDTIQHLDVKVGRVLERLRNEGLYDQTIIFFFGDHGRPMPRGKQFLYEGGIRIPLIVRIPEKFSVEGYRPGTVSDDLISAIDITATTLRLAGIEPPAYMQGRPFLGPGVRKRDYIVAARDRCDETIDRIRCVCDRRFKYIRNFYPDRPYTQQNVYKDLNYPTLRVMKDMYAQGKLTGPPALFLAPERPAEELYDLQADPWEIRNLASDPSYRATLERMRKILADWIQTTGDQGQYPEKEIPVEDQDRTEAEGWCTQAGARAFRRDRRLVVQCKGRSASLARCVVAEGGDFVLEFRARSTQVAPRQLQRGTIEQYRNPVFRSQVEFAADGRWHDVAVPFHVDGWLSLVAVDFGNAEGEIEFDWIRLSRVRGGEAGVLEQWDFA